MTHVIATAAALTFTALACLHAGAIDTGQVKPQPPPPGAATQTTGGSDAQTIAAFNQRLKAYADLHNKIEKTLPPLPKETSPAAIDKHQRALGALLLQQRKTAKRGDLFTPDMERLIRRVFGQIFKGTEGAKLKATVMDENPANVRLAVNSRYPDEVPLSTMPAQVLAMLPQLPDDLEYRFIGNRLILLDVHAHTIADYIENALP